MAVSGKLFTTALKHIGNGDIVWKASGGSDIRVALMTSSFSPDQDAMETWASTGVSTNEIAASGGYTAGGAALSLSDPTTDSATNRTRFKASAATTWATSSFTARYALVYKYNATGSLAYLIGWIDFGADQTSVSADFTITWDSTDGVFYGAAA